MYVIDCFTAETPHSKSLWTKQNVLPLIRFFPWPNPHDKNGIIISVNLDQPLCQANVNQIIPISHLW